MGGNFNVNFSLEKRNGSIVIVLDRFIKEWHVDSKFPHRKSAKFKVFGLWTVLRTIRSVEGKKKRKGKEREEERKTVGREEEKEREKEGKIHKKFYWITRLSFGSLNVRMSEVNCSESFCINNHSDEYETINGAQSSVPHWIGRSTPPFRQGRPPCKSSSYKTTLRIGPKDITVG